MPTQPVTPADSNSDPSGGTTPTSSGGSSDDTTPPENQNAAPVITSPLAVSRTLAGGTSDNRSVQITATVTDSDFDACQLSVNDVAITDASCMLRNGTNDTYDLSYTWVVDSQAQSGNYVVSLTATDKAGGQSQPSSANVTVDNTAPTVTIENGGIIKSGSASPNVTATDDSGIGSYFWTASSSNPEKLDFDPTVKEPTFTPDIEGTYVFYVDVTDSLGNVSSQNEYDFGFKRDLETVPLPTTTDPTTALADQTPSTPAIVAASANPAIKSGRDEISTSDNSAVLGNTVTAPGQAPPTKTVATITPTDKGWSIFGVLWYWWAVVIGIFFAGWVLLKRVVRRRIPENS